MIQRRKSIRRKIQWILPILMIVFALLSIDHSIRVNEVDISDNFAVNKSGNLKIIHLSDIHIEDLDKKINIEDLIKTINDLQGDIIVYTGDYGSLEEMKKGYEIFPKLKCRYKKYAVIGNHDYGDNERAEDNWKSKEDKQEKEQQLKALYKKWGFDLLLNESDTISHNNNLIAVVGLKVHDPHHGFFDSDLQTAIYNITGVKNKILLMHNPDLWTEEVVGKYDIKLTLAGHTHGAQVGMGIGDYKISPAQLMFAEWRGLYEKDNEILIVNTGIGTYGLPFRIGMDPEIISVTMPLL